MAGHETLVGEWGALWEGERGFWGSKIDLRRVSRGLAVRFWRPAGAQWNLRI